MLLLSFIAGFLTGLALVQICLSAALPLQLEGSSVGFLDARTPKNGKAAANAVPAKSSSKPPVKSPSKTPTPTPTPKATPTPTPTPVTPPKALWQPAVQAKAQIILSQIVSIDPKNPSVTPDYPIYDVDMFGTPKTTIQALQSIGKKVICYFSAGTSENWRPDFSNFTAAVQGNNLGGWPGERWLDIRSPLVVSIMNARIKMAADKGCDAIDPDNMDGYANNPGFSNPKLTMQDSITYFTGLANTAKSYGMSIGLKNAQDMLSAVSSLAQFAVNEECVAYNECALYKQFTNPQKFGALPGGAAFGKPVFHIEYVARSGSSVSSSDFPSLSGDALRQRLCLTDGAQTPGQADLMLSTEIRTQALDGWEMDCSGNVATTSTVAGS